MKLSSTLAAETIGSGLLLAIVIGSGIMAEQLAGGNVAVALLGNTFATVFGLYVLIEIFGPLSGAHFNPVVSVIQCLRKQLNPSYAAAYIVAQLVGALLGAVLANTMFDLSPLHFAHKLRGGSGQFIGEVIATAGLILVALMTKKDKASALVASYIGAAYWFTSSTSFANPAAVFGRMFSDSFAGIAPASAPLFILAQCLGGLLGWGLSCFLKGANHTTNSA